MICSVGGNPRISLYIPPYSWISFLDTNIQNNSLIHALSVGWRGACDTQQIDVITEAFVGWVFNPASNYIELKELGYKPSLRHLSAR